MPSSTHLFHIPVMGLGYTVDTPLKVARFGISSAVSIMDDQLLEEMRRLHSRKLQVPYQFIPDNAPNARAERITAYLNFLQDEVDKQVQKLKDEDFDENREIHQYFQLLPESHHLKVSYERMITASPADKTLLQKQLKERIVPGSIDVNIMTKVDKINHDKSGNELPREYSDALSALRGFAYSKVSGSVVFSAGLNPALYSYAAQFPDFFPNASGEIKKGIILKVSDYRSALIQGKFLAKKGLWISEFRIESGLNCGGHAFATDGFLAGPILEEFKNNRKELTETLWSICQQSLQERGEFLLPDNIQPKITYQGGIGNAPENQFLMEYYALDGTGWGSPFLLVPEATSVDEDTLDRLIKAKKSDFYLSHASPLGVPFNNLRNSSGENQRKERIAKKRPGSPCYKKFLAFSKELSDKPICTASRQYQNLKVKQFDTGEISEENLNSSLEKDCLCEGLSAPAILANGEIPKRNLKAVTICPGPNLAYFKGIFSLKEMVNHIYGKIHLQLEKDRPHLFIKEAELYMEHIKREFENYLKEPTKKYETYLEKFKSNLENGIEYYQKLIDEFTIGTEEAMEKMKQDLQAMKLKLQEISPCIPQ